MIFNDAFWQVDVRNAVSVVACCRIVCVRAVGAVDDGLSMCQLAVDYHHFLRNLHSP